MIETRKIFDLHVNFSRRCRKNNDLKIKMKIKTFIPPLLYFPLQSCLKNCLIESAAVVIVVVAAVVVVVPVAAVAAVVVSVVELISCTPL